MCIRDRGKKLNATDWTMKFYNKPNSSTPLKEIIKVLAGRRHSYDGWELADAQLAMRIKTFLEKKWTHMYLTNEQNMICLHHNGIADFCKEYNIPGTPNWPELAKGFRKVKGWNLISEAAFNATPGPTFGTPNEAP